MEEQVKVDVENKEQTSTVNNNLKTFSRRARILIVLAAIVVFALMMFINLKGEYLKYAEIGEKFVSVFEAKVKNEYNVFCISIFFLALSFIYSAGASMIAPIFFLPFNNPSGEDSPNNSILPAVGIDTPDNILIIVVLPAPFCPINP